MTVPDALPALAPADTEPDPQVAALDVIAAGEAYDRDVVQEIRRKAAAALAFVGLPTPEELGVMVELATAYVHAGLIPDALRSHDPAISRSKVMVIFLKGRELGIPPSAALDNIHVVNGKPGLSAALMMGKVQQAGHRIEIPHRSADRAVAWGRRSDTGSELTIEWTWDMAVRAQLVGKDTYKNYPDAMLTWRAVSALCRLHFADVLLGAVYTPEELGAETDAAGVPLPSGLSRQRRPAAVAAAPAADPAPAAAAPADPPAAPVDDAAAAAADPPPVDEETPPAAPPPTPSMPVLLRIVEIACERLQTKPTRLMAALAIKIQKNYEDASPDELWAFLRTDVARRLRAKGMDLPDPVDVVLPEPPPPSDEAAPGEPTEAAPDPELQAEPGFAPGDGPTEEDLAAAAAAREDDSAATE